MKLKYMKMKCIWESDRSCGTVCAYVRIQILSHRRKADSKMNTPLFNIECRDGKKNKQNIYDVVLYMRQRHWHAYRTRAPEHQQFEIFGLFVIDRLQECVFSSFDQIHLNLESKMGSSFRPSTSEMYRRRTINISLFHAASCSRPNVEYRFTTCISLGWTPSQMEIEKHKSSSGTICSCYKWLA